MHAKAVIVDRRKAFVTSANFTEAAQARNIEAGVVVDDTAFAERMARQLDALVEQGAVVGV
ncbi:MAG: phospholipase D-like domain-containing protein [bacterium]